MEPPDFQQMARMLRNAALIATEAPDGAVAAIAEQLRQVWNARGAADMAEARLFNEAPTEMVVSAIRKLNR